MSCQRFFGLFILLFFSGGENYAQEGRSIDSLLQVVNKSVGGIDKVDALNHLYEEYLKKDTAQAMVYVRAALREAELIDYKKGIVRSCNYYGRQYRSKGKYPEAIEILLKALRISKSIGYLKGLAGSHSQLGHIYFDQGKFAQCADHYFKAYDAAEQANSEWEMAIGLTSIGKVYGVQGEFQKAIDAFEEALAVYEVINDLSGIAGCLNNMAIDYLNLGQAEKAFDFHSRALEIKRQMLVADPSRQNKSLLASSLTNIGVMYSEHDATEKAILYYQEALDIFEEIGNQYGESVVLVNLGHMQLKGNNSDSAFAYLHKAIEIAMGISSLNTVQVAAQYLSDGYLEMDDHVNALKYYKVFANMRDSLRNEQTDMRLVELQEKYETAQKDKENEVLKSQNAIQELQINQKNNQVYGVLGAAILAITMSLLALMYLRGNAQRKITRVEQKLLRLQMNPHFIFNALIAIQSYTLKNKPGEAAHYIASFAKLMRSILESSRKEYISLDKEIKTLEYYFQLQQLRFEDKFDFKIHLDESIKSKSILIPPMLAQPFIENSLEHGNLQGSEQGRVNCNFFIRHDMLYFELEDNGIGRQESAKNKKMKLKSHQSLATKITEERLSILNKGKRNAIKLKIEDLDLTKEGQTGTKITFSLPLIYNGKDGHLIAKN